MYRIKLLTTLVVAALVAGPVLARGDDRTRRGDTSQAKSSQQRHGLHQQRQIRPHQSKARHNRHQAQRRGQVRGHNKVQNRPRRINDSGKGRLARDQGASQSRNRHMRANQRANGQRRGLHQQRRHQGNNPRAGQQGRQGLVRQGDGNQRRFNNQRRHQNHRAGQGRHGRGLVSGGRSAMEDRQGVIRYGQDRKHRGHGRDKRHGWRKDHDKRHVSGYGGYHGGKKRHYGHHGKYKSHKRYRYHGRYYPSSGLFTRHAPLGASLIYIGGIMHYVWGHTYYRWRPAYHNYEIVYLGEDSYNDFYLPAGTVVEYLPDQAYPVYRNGVLYYRYWGLYFLPLDEGGFLVVDLY